MVVEHDPLMIRAADHIVEMGPASGKARWPGCLRGATRTISPTGPLSPPVTCAATIASRYRRPAGPATAQCSVSPAQPNTISRTCWSGSPAHARLHHRRVGLRQSTLIEGDPDRAAARAFRIESLPMGKFQAIKGLEHLNGAPSSTSSRSAELPAPTRSPYLKAFDEIRQNCSPLNEMPCGRASPRAFSFNCGRRPLQTLRRERLRKAGDVLFGGYLRTCEECSGRRFKPEILAVKYRGKTIHDVLNLTVSDAQAFSPLPKLTEKLYLLSSIGLGYLRIGQSRQYAFRRRTATAEKSPPNSKDPSAQRFCFTSSMNRQWGPRCQRIWMTSRNCSPCCTNW